MAYFIFNKNLDNVVGTIFRIVENQFDLNNLNINQADYKIIEDSSENFNDVKYGTKIAESYNGNTIKFISVEPVFRNKDELSMYIRNCLVLIKDFTINNKSHPLFNKWDSYFNQLFSLDLDSITYPLNKSLEQYFKDQNQPSLSPLQLP